MGAWLLRTPLVHGALKPANIIVMPGGADRLVNYEAMRVPQMDDYAEHAADDRVALANLALGLTVLSASPEAYRALNGNSVFRTPVLRSSLLHLFDDLAHLLQVSGPLPRLHIPAFIIFQRKSQLIRAVVPPHPENGNRAAAVQAVMRLPVFTLKVNPFQRFEASLRIGEGFEQLID